MFIAKVRSLRLNFRPVEDAPVGRAERNIHLNDSGAGVGGEQSLPGGRAKVGVVLDGQRQILRGVDAEAERSFTQREVSQD